MSELDSCTYTPWVDLRIDGALSATQSAELAEHLPSCDCCLGQERQLQTMNECLKNLRIAPRADLVDEVMKRLGSRPTEASGRVWVAMAAVLMGLSLLGGLALLQTGSDGSGAGLATGLGDFVVNRARSSPRSRRRSGSACSRTGSSG